MQGTHPDTEKIDWWNYFLSPRALFGVSQRESQREAKVLGKVLGRVARQARPLMCLSTSRKESLRALLRNYSVPLELASPTNDIP